MRLFDGLLAFLVRKDYRKMDKENKKDKKVWHYECVNGHKWKSYSSPTSTYCRDKYGMTETCCPECKSVVCKGDVYVNGKLTGMGAQVIGFAEHAVGEMEDKK